MTDVPAPKTATSPDQPEMTANPADPVDTACSDPLPQPGTQPSFFTSRTKALPGQFSMAPPDHPGCAAWNKVADQLVSYCIGVNRYASFNNIVSSRRVLVASFLDTRFVRSNKDGMALCGAALKDEAYRRQHKDGTFAATNFCDENTVGSMLLAFDLDNTDGQKRLHALSAELDRRGVAHSAYSTHSHTDAHEKARLILQLKTPIPTSTDEDREIYKVAYNLIGADLCGGTHDRTCDNPARKIYLPSHDGKTPVFSLFIPGDLLDPTPYVEQARAEVAARGVRHTVSRPPRPTDPNDPLEQAVAAHLRDYADRTDLPAFFLAIGWNIRCEKSDCIEIECPFDAVHSNAGELKDTACAVWSPDAANNGVCNIRCLHEHCKGRRREEFIVQAMRVTNTGMAELQAQTSLTDAERMGADEAALTALVDGFNPQTPNPDIDRALQALATRRCDLFVFKTVSDISDNTEIPKGDLNKMLAQYRKERRGCGRIAQGPPDDAGPGGIVIGETGFVESRSISWNAIQSRNEPEPYFFDSATALSRLQETDTGELIAEPLTQDDVRFELNNLCLWFRKSRDGVLYSTAADEDIVKEVFSTPNPAVPKLKEIVRTPVFIPSGRLVIRHGFDKESGIYHHPVPGFQPLDVPEKPTSDQVREARDLIRLEYLRDFPFSDQYAKGDSEEIYTDAKDADGWSVPNLQRGMGARANAMAMILHPHLAAIIDDCSPLFMVDATVSGSGKGFLTNCVTFISEGRVSPKRPSMKESYQIRTAVTSAVMARQRVFLLDNIKHHLDDGVLENAITSGIWADRILGGNREISVPLRLQFMVTMNQGTMSPDLLRRTCPIRLDPKVEHARDRPSTTFKHALPSWALQERPRLLWACHVLVANWFALGQPAGREILQSFEKWSQVIGGVLQAAGVPGFLSNVENLHSQRDEGSTAANAFVQEWSDTYAEKEVVTDDLYFTEKTSLEYICEFKYPKLIETDDYRDKDPKRRLGRCLMKMAGRTFAIQVNDKDGNRVLKDGVPVLTKVIVVEGEKDRRGVLRRLQFQDASVAWWRNA